MISRCKNDKPWKNQLGKVPVPLLRRPAPAPYFHPPFFNFSDFPSNGGNSNLIPPPQYSALHFQVPHWQK